jgi:anthranilate synthase component 1
MLSPSREECLQLANKGGPIPLTREVLADMETPLSVYWKLAHEEPFSFLLESVTGGDQLARYSVIGVRPKKVARSKGSTLREITQARETKRELEPGEDPVKAIFDMVPQIDQELCIGLPKLCGGAVGIIGYDYIRHVEKLPYLAEDDLDIDDVAMMLMETVVVFDHAKNLIQIITLSDGTDESYLAAEAEAERILAKMRAPLPVLPRSKGEKPEFEFNMTADDYKDIVRRCREYIVAGDIFQVVPSRRTEAAASCHPVTFYRAIRSLNPSPYMFFFRFGDYDVVGASPEILTAVSGGVARVRPIAGTRPRGATPAEDDALAEDLLADKKERAEHIMLVDLGRNDLGRVCQYGTVTVDELMIIERYSHVMHIVSNVTGMLQPGMTAAELVRATFPAGTVSGAPKVRAMEIIEEVEPTRRGIYAGAIGYFSASGDLDIAITIRTALMKNGRAYIQSGGGIVYDSDPEFEYQESVNKAKAMMHALEIAETGLEGQI